MDGLTVLGWALLAVGALIAVAAVVVRTRRPGPDPVDEHYRTAAAALQPDHRALPPHRCDCTPCRMERATARQAARLVAETERWLRRQAAR